MILYKPLVQRRLQRYGTHMQCTLCSIPIGALPGRRMDKRHLFNFNLFVFFVSLNYSPQSQAFEAMDQTGKGQI